MLQPALQPPSVIWCQRLEDIHHKQVTTDRQTDEHSQDLDIHH